MSLSHDSGSTIVCKEVFDENSQPSEKEILDYAKRLGIDPDSEPYLLDLAREGLMAALPTDWAPAYDDTSRSFYYYQRSTKVSTWEHPLDAVYKELVVQARASNRRRASVDEDTKTGAEAEPQGESGPSTGVPAPTLLTSPTTRIPLKLALLKRHRSEGSSTGFQRRLEASLDRLTRSWKSGETEFESHSSSSRSSLSSDRASRDYTNLYFQDPEFYKSPKIIDTGKKQLNLNDVFKRSESLSPRHEKEWKQLSGWFSATEENIIDINNLSATSLGAKSRTPEDQLETPNSKVLSPMQHQPRKAQYPKELTLSGGGSIFLKSNRSRDVTPCTDGSKLGDFQDVSNGSSNLAAGTLDEMTASAGERLKSILREKTCEDDDKPMDEERKSVRFDLHKVSIPTSTKFNDGDSCEEAEDSEPEERTSGSLSITAARRDAAVLSLQQILNRQGGIDFGSSNSFVKSIGIEAKKTKVVGRRFVVENVSEKEHIQQQEDKSIDNDESISNKFENIKNIDLISKSDSEKTTPRSSGDSRSSFLDELRKNKELMLENMKKAELRANKSESEENKMTTIQSVWPPKTLRSLDLCKEGSKNSTFEKPKFSSETVKNVMMKEHEREIQALRQDLDVKLEETKNQLEEEFNMQKLSLQSNMQERLVELRTKMSEEEKQYVEKLVADMNESRTENLKKMKSELEICYEKERQDILTNLKSELDQRKHELLELREQQISKLENEHERGLEDEKQAKAQELQITRQYSEKTENLKKELEKEFDILRMELRVQQRDKIAKITEDHEKCLSDILRDFRKDEAVARKVYKQKLDEIRAEYSKDFDNEIKKQNEFAVRQESVDFEKIRCQKRLLEDKYNTLKEKYLKLKNDMRAANERRQRHKEQMNSTVSETETSSRTRSERTESSEQKLPLTKTNSVSNSKPKEIPSQNPNALKEQQPDTQQQCAAKANQTTIAEASPKTLKFESDDTTTCSETTSNLMMISKKKKCLKKSSSGANKLNNNVVDNPVENIRKQLEKLEDLGDQLPSNDTAYIVRYPFQDKSPSNVCSELEFFRHRIHVERDSVKRAREALRHQRSAFQCRQRTWKQQSARATLEQLVKEERELSDMEVSLHRTRSLLGEKVIHLRYLEQSLERVANSKRNENEQTTAKSDEMTLSDISSASSGFSSTDLATDTFIESTEIITSLENLNSEIREIWGVLNKRQDNTMPPPPTLMYTDLSWFPYQRLASQPRPVSAFGTPNIQSNILSQLTAPHPPSATHNIIAQYGPTSGYTTSVGTIDGASASNLIERTRNLKDWLRQARVESSDLVSPGQATL